MQALTSAVLAAFVLYAGSWYFGFVEGNFALLLFVATLVTGVYWLAERFYFLPQRQNAAVLLEVAVRALSTLLKVLARRSELVCKAMSRASMPLKAVCFWTIFC